MQQTNTYTHISYFTITSTKKYILQRQKTKQNKIMTFSPIFPLIVLRFFPTNSPSTTAGGTMSQFQSTRSLSRPDGTAEITDGFYYNYSAARRDRESRWRSCHIQNRMNYNQM